MSETVTEYSPSKPKDIKLKAACNQCNAAKVKCSSDKAGCRRCQNLAVNCQYTESRVGKVPGVRARKKKRQNPFESIDTMADIQPPRASLTSASPPSESLLPNVFDNALMNWPTNLETPVNSSFALFGDATHLLETGRSSDTPTTNANRHSSSITSGDNFSSLGCDLVVPDLDFGVGEESDFLPSDHNTHNIETSTSSKSDAECSMEPHQPPRRNIDSHCVLACTQIISSLEDYILAELKALDLTLEVVRQTVDKLNYLVNFQQLSRSFRCVALFSVVMYQIIELLEVGCAGFLSDGENEGLGVLANGLRSGSTSSFGLGAFRMNAREQKAWRADVVMKELERSWEILQKIISLARGGPQQPCRSTAEDRAACYSELEGRLRTLRERVGGYK